MLSSGFLFCLVKPLPCTWQVSIRGDFFLFQSLIHCMLIYGRPRSPMSSRISGPSPAEVHRGEEVTAHTAEEL